MAEHKAAISTIEEWNQDDWNQWRDMITIHRTSSEKTNIIGSSEENKSETPVMVRRDTIDPLNTTRRPPFSLPNFMLPPDTSLSTYFEPAPWPGIGIDPAVLNLRSIRGIFPVGRRYDIAVEDMHSTDTVWYSIVRQTDFEEWVATQTSSLFSATLDPNIQSSVGTGSLNIPELASWTEITTSIIRSRNNKTEGKEVRYYGPAFQFGDEIEDWWGPIGLDEGLVWILVGKSSDSAHSTARDPFQSLSQIEIP